MEFGADTVHVKLEASRTGRTKRRSEPQQLVLFRPRGGKLRGAGRPPKGQRAGSPHKERPFLHARYPVHVVLRVVGAVGSLRRRCVYQAIREATLTTALREDFRIVQLSLQRTHVHLLVEADDKAALARGMQGFQISAAKHLNAAISKGKPGPRRRGVVFPDRYHAEIITSPAAGQRQRPARRGDHIGGGIDHKGAGVDGVRSVALVIDPRRDHAAQRPDARIEPAVGRPRVQHAAPALHQ